MSNIVKGYKVFDKNWTCRGFKYEVGKTYEDDVVPLCDERGFYFCKDLNDCFNYYSFNPQNKVAEVEALGDINEDEDRCCTNKIRIVRELTWEEVLRLANSGYNNSGYGNSGDCNSGYGNSGDYNSGGNNSGYYNSGYYNSGDHNSGGYNIGDFNSGNSNSGYSNSGYSNSGNYNSGRYNSGNYNSGRYNSGNHNSGDCNSGNHNSGDCNSGNYNSGDYNSGNHNSGDYNSGNHNSGDFNKTNFSNGCFNTTEHKIYLFNKASDWTYQEWLRSRAHSILYQIPMKCVPVYIPLKKMTDDEKKKYPEAEVTRGYLKICDNTEEVNAWWRSLPQDERETVKSLPNFDKDIFKEITGIDIDK